METKRNIDSSKLLLGTMFFVSGFCGLLYQTIWLRLAFAEFGVIAPVVSIVVSVFMLGLGLGSWGGGRYISSWKNKLGGCAISVYALVEIFIGLGAFAVPKLFSWGGNLLGNVTVGTDNWFYLAGSAAVISVSMLPWAIAMGMTYPVVVEFVHDLKNDNTRSFGFLYAANTAGACLGAIATVFILIEILGFRHTLMLAAVCNFLIGLIAANWGRRIQSKAIIKNNVIEQVVSFFPESKDKRVLSLMILFITGFCSMAMEVAWVRSFSVQLGSVVYSFSTVLAVYLLSNWFGAFLYRADLGRDKIKPRSFLISMAAVFSTIPLIVSCPKMWTDHLLGLYHYLLLPPVDSSCFSCLLPISVVLFSIALGYLTPLIVDDLSAGKSAEAGTAYATNIFGCILGPLFSGYVLLPSVGVRFSLILLILPLAILAVVVGMEKGSVRKVQIASLAMCLLILASSCFYKSWEEGAFLPEGPQKIAVMHRDYSATTIATSFDGCMALLVNGIGMTGLDTMVKLMVHIPMAFHKGMPKSIVVICYGMGTTFRSALSWGAKVTAVELLPSVIESSGYFHADAGTVLKNPDGHIVIDDGRRFLKRTKEKFDVITLDPPPPPETAASSLLYSKEFYKLVQKRLNPGGILQQWYGFPQGEKVIFQAVIRSLVEVFPYVRIYPAYCWDNKTLGGWYILAADTPIQQLSGKEMLALLPEKSKKDLYEWAGSSAPEKNITALLDHVLSHPIRIDSILSSIPQIEITDDHPMNEYYWLRRHLAGKQVFIGN